MSLARITVPSWRPRRLILVYTLSVVVGVIGGLGAVLEAIRVPFARRSLALGASANLVS